MTAGYIQRPISNVSLVTRPGSKRVTVFADAVPLSGVVNVQLKAERGERPTVLIEVLQPALGYGKPRVRRPCLTRPHVPDAA